MRLQIDGPSADGPGFAPWDQAWDRALYGSEGFYLRPEGPAGHFATAAHTSQGGLLAAALVRLAQLAGCRRVVDVGAGRGELLAAVSAVPDAQSLDLVAVDLCARPRLLPSRVGWATSVPAPTAPTLLLGWELLDVVPCPVLEADGEGDLRVIHVSSTGSEETFGEPSPPDLAWCRRWWPGPYAPGQRVEVGRARDELWAAMVSTGLGDEGLAVAVDYEHALGSRPHSGSLAGFRSGRACAPVPDGRHDLTAHVALDSVAAAVQTGRPELTTGRTTQHAALHALAVSGRRPEADRARTDPTGYLADLSRAGEASVLLDPDGLGGFGWLLAAAGEDAEGALRTLTTRTSINERDAAPGCST